jgi:acyl-coenzyme A synthetase/AMP-(fatty) acid ligase
VAASGEHCARIDAPIASGKLPASLVKLGLDKFTPIGVFEHVERYRVSHGAFVPVQFQRMLDAANAHQHDSSSLETIMCCGSPLPTPTAAVGCAPVTLAASTRKDSCMLSIARRT